MIIATYNVWYSDVGMPMRTQQLIDEIKEMLAKANAMDCLERTAFLKQQNKQYKKSHFYKTTHTSLTKLYLLYTLEGVNKLSHLGNSVLFTELSKGNYAILGAVVNDIISSIDMTTVKNLVEDALAYVASNMQDVELPNLQNEFSTILSDFKESLKK